MVNLEITAYVYAINNSRLSGYFCSDCFQFKQKGVDSNGNKNMKKGLDYAPIQNKINELKLKQSFEEFCRSMHRK